LLGILLALSADLCYGLSQALVYVTIAYPLEELIDEQVNILKSYWIVSSSETEDHTVE
jgi:hypothetical protein